MARISRKRVKIKGHYMQIRQRSTSKGKKGTVVGKWASSRGKKRLYRCSAAVKTRERKICGHGKAGSYCMYQNGRRKKCSRLLIAYR